MSGLKDNEVDREVIRVRTPRLFRPKRVEFSLYKYFRTIRCGFKVLEKDKIGKLIEGVKQYVVD